MSSVERIEGRGFEGFSAFRLSYRALGAVAASFDGLVFVLSSILARTLYFGPTSLEGADVGLGVVAALFYLLLGRSWGFFRVQILLAPERNLARIAAAALFGVTSVVCLLFLLKTGSDHSRAVMALFAVSASVLTPAERLLFSLTARLLVASDFVRGRRVVLIGDVEELERLKASDMLHFGFDEVARFGLSQGHNAEPLSTADRLRVEQTINAARLMRASEIALFVPWSRDRALAEITNGLRGSPLPVRLYPDHSTRDVLRQKRERHFDPHLSVEVQRKPLRSLGTMRQARLRCGGGGDCSARAVAPTDTDGGSDKTRHSRPHHIQASAPRIRQSRISHLEVPHNDRPRGRARIAASATGRRSRHSHGTNSPTHERRRTAAARQRVERGHVDCGASTPCRRPRRILRGADQRIRLTQARETGSDRGGASEGLKRRDA